HDESDQQDRITGVRREPDPRQRAQQDEDGRDRSDDACSMAIGQMATGEHADDGADSLQRYEEPCHDGRLAACVLEVQWQHSRAPEENKAEDRRNRDRREEIASAEERQVEQPPMSTPARVEREEGDQYGAATDLGGAPRPG